MSIESQSYSRENLEADIFADTQKELSWLKESILGTNIEEKKEWFWTYLQTKGIDKNEFPRDGWVGKFLRTFRYYKEIKDISTEKWIPTSYFFALKMIEGEGDPSAINTIDWWTWISQIQPDTFKWFCSTQLKKNYKVFYDDPKYTYYNYDNLTKNLWYTREKANYIIAQQLLKIRKDCNYDMTKLMALDDRFNPQIALEFSAEYLLYCKKYVDVKTLTDESRDKYKNDKEYDFERMLAFNGYNKWPKRFGVDFTGNHLKNLKTRIDQYNLYSQRLSDLLKKWYSYEEVLFNIKKEEKDRWKISEDSLLETSISKKTVKIPDFISQPKEPESAIPTIDSDLFGIPEKQQKPTLTFLNKSADKQRNVYKTILIKDIKTIIDLNDIYKQLPGKKLQFTNATWEKIEAAKLLTMKKWDVLYIREKI